uniref:DNA topoisomerase n=1 Tax=viral metagenome TaxID=1070528 RepID=A0A6C0CRG0_9ZZZZ
MPYIAVLVESPAKCGKIEKFLGPGYKCMATFGHIRSLDNLNNIDIANNFKPTFTDVSSKYNQIKKLKSFIAQSDDVMLAADDDREGEAIAWHVCKMFNLPVSSTKRIIFHEITESALKQAVSSPTRINMELVRAQQARQILDILVGFKLSPILWSKIQYKTKRSLSAGRCQTPALRLIYDNQVEIDNSPGKKVYNTTGYFTSQNLGFSLDFNHEGEESMGDFLEESVNFDHMFDCGKVRNTTKKPPSPFTTSALQQAASNELRLSPKATMDSCQKLYEAGYITYMRTDSTTYSAEFIAKAGKYIINKYGEEYKHPNIEKLSERKEDKKSKKKKSKKDENNAQEAHEAIRPTKIECDSIDEGEKLGSREVRLYNLIRQNTLESCMADAKYKAITAKITAPEDNVYKYSCEQVIFPGWKIVGGYDEESADYNYLKAMKKQKLEYNKIISKVTMKELKSHYTEARLVQLLEQNGIGRPSTFSSLVDKIQERGYVKKDSIKGKPIECVDFELEGDIITENANTRDFGGERNKLIIQPLGLIVIEFLLEHFDPLFNYEYTKNMEDTLDSIAKGDSVWHELCRDCLTQIETLSEPLGLVEKVTIPIDEDHVYMVAKYGPCIKCTKGGKTTFKKVKEGINLTKLKNGEYTLADIIQTKAAAKNDNIIGKHKDSDVVLRNGRYGMYIEWKGNKINITIEKDYKDVTLDDVREYLVSPIIREITKDASIRVGKYGDYIYYKTSRMKKPRFLHLKKFVGDYKTMEKKELIEWINETHKIEL